MQAERSQIPRSAFLVAGMAAGMLARAWQAGKSRRLTALEETVDQLRGELRQARSELDEKLARMETRVEEHEQRLNEIPSTAQIVEAMEGLIGRTMHSLDERLSSQSESIELLKTTVSQTDDLLERVLDSLDALRQDASPDASAAFTPEPQR